MGLEKSRRNTQRYSSFKGQKKWRIGKSKFCLAKAAEKPEKPKLLERQKVNESKKVKSEVRKPTKSAPPKTVTEKVEKAAEKIEKSVNKENVENGLDDGKFHF